MIGRGIIATLLVAAVIVWQHEPMATEPAPSSAVDPCSTYFHTDISNAGLVSCPAGDGHTLAEVGTGIDLWVKDFLGNPGAGIPGSDIWLIAAFGELALCGGSGSCDADAPTDALGFTTIRNTTIAAGGCSNYVCVVVQGMVVEDPANCSDPALAPIIVRSPDLDGDLDVDVTDFVMFATAWPPGSYDECVDLDLDGEVALRDLAYFALHFLHRCE